MTAFLCIICTILRADTVLVTLISFSRSHEDLNMSFKVDVEVSCVHDIVITSTCRLIVSKPCIGFIFVSLKTRVGFVDDHRAPDKRGN